MDGAGRVPKRVQVKGEWYDVKSINTLIKFHLINADQKAVYDMTCPYCYDEWYFKVWYKDDGCKSIGDFHTQIKNYTGAVTGFEL